MVTRYWAGIQRGNTTILPCPRPFASTDTDLLSAEAAWLADTAGRAAAQIDPVKAGYLVGTIYAAALPPDIRSRLGVYYTPPALAAHLLDQATAAGLDWHTCTVLDPACGGGAFLAPVAERLSKHLSHLEPPFLLDAIATRVRGFEIDPVAAWLSQVFLEATVLPTSRAAGRRLPVLVAVLDTLQVQPSGVRYDLVIGNPPYGRIALSPELRAGYAQSLYGHANLYGVFTELALRWVRPGGIVSYVTPTSFLAGEYFKNLRRLLATTAPPAALDFIAHRKGVFDDVLQEALLATYRVGAPCGDMHVGLVTPVDESVARLAAVGSCTLPPRPGEPWLIPRHARQVPLTERMRSMPHRLADWGYTVSTGPLVWNRHKDQLRTGAGPGLLPLIWAEAITPDGRFILRATKATHRQYFKPKADDGWLVTTKPCVLVQRTTAKEQSRRLVATVLPSHLLKRYGGVVIENHVNMIRSTGVTPAVAPATLAAFLNSHAADEAFRCLSGSVAVSAYELEALPLPPPTALRELDGELSGGADREAVEHICARLYGQA